MVQLDEDINRTQNSSSTSFMFLPFLYGFVSLILLGRFLINLFSIIRTIRGNRRTYSTDHWIVLVGYPTLPFTFFRNVIVNKVDYEQRIIDQRIIQHEVTHARQLHTVDIIIVELAKVFLWINPFVWLIKRPIQLNHEYLADNSVLANNDTSEYQHILLDLVLCNSSGSLTSNFNFSLTKPRLKMMTRRFSMNHAVANIFATSILVFFLGSALALNNKDFEYKLAIEGKPGNYVKKELKHSDFGMMEITTSKKRLNVEKFEIMLARGPRIIRLDPVIGKSFDLKWYSKRAKNGDRIVIKIKELSDKDIELTQYNSIITLPIDFDK